VQGKYDIWPAANRDLEIMAALRKQKKYNWKETNLALFGSELEKQVKKVVNDG